MYTVWTLEAQKFFKAWFFSIVHFALKFFRPCYIPVALIYPARHTISLGTKRFRTNRATFNFCSELFRWEREPKSVNIFSSCISTWDAFVLVISQWLWFPLSAIRLGTKRFRTNRAAYYFCPEHFRWERELKSSSKCEFLPLYISPWDAFVLVMS